MKYENELRKLFQTFIIVVLTLSPALSPIISVSSNTTHINAESFEGEWPPTGWTETGRWNKESDQAYDGTYSADFDGSYTTRSGYLTSPSMNCSNADAIYVEFWWRDDDLDDDDFMLEYYDGSNWDNYQDMNQLSHNEDEWTLYSDNITDDQYFVSNFQIRWYAKSVGNGECAWVDLVTVKNARTESRIDLYTQRGGEGPNQPSDAFSPGEQVILYAYVTHKNDPVEGKLVAFEVRDPTNANVLDRTGETNAYGLTAVNFTLPTTCIPGQVIIGEWTAIAVVSLAEITVNDTLTFRVTGAMIDLYTQRNGKGPNMPSDAFAPQEEVIFYAYVSYDCNPTEGKLVAFEVRDANDTCVTYKTATTNASGIATVSFRIPSMPPFGIWNTTATVEVLEKTIGDTLTFKVGWIIEILMIQAVDEYGNPQTTFRREEQMYFNVTVQNIAFISKMATLTIVVYDECSVPIGQVMPQNWLMPPETKSIFIIGLPTPKWAFLGVGTLYANAYTDLLQLGGTPYCPEISTTFIIIKP